MKRKTIFLTIIFLFFLANLVFIGSSISPKNDSKRLFIFDNTAEKKEPFLAADKIDAAKKYISGNGYNDQYCFMINMGLPSGSNRFFVYDLKKDSIIRSGLVTHGRCNEQWLEGRRYSNVVGSGCTSLGFYKIGASYIGKFGLAYKLHGLDSTNNNAFARYVVLHSHACVPGRETEGEICQSDGCPTVSPGFLSYLENLLSRSDKPVLLTIY